MKAITNAYQSIRAVLPLGGEDVGAIAQALHTALRRERPDSKGNRDLTHLLTLAEILVTDLQANKLPPNHVAHLHLLAFYKEAQHLDKGSDFWDWLVEQDDSYLSPAVYGAAIELRAVQGRPADETEHLYTQALQRFPGSFNEYHLSDNAVLSDRDQPIHIAGIPVTLLQGILTARLLRGDSKAAYMTLDTALRLFPTQLPSRFFTLFVDERPMSEAYKVFMLACRSGTTLAPDCLKALLTKLRHVAVADPLTNASVLRSMLTASYAFAASGATLTSNHLTELVIAVTSILRHSAISNLPREETTVLADHVLLTVSRLFDIWAGQGARPGIAAFNSIITNVAGKGQRKDVLETCLADMQSLGLQPNAVTRRSLLTAAGDLGDGLILRSAWGDLMDLRRTTRAFPDLSDWQTLAKAAKTMGEEDFVRQQLEEAGDHINPFLATRVDGMLQESSRKGQSAGTDGSLEDFRQLIAALLKDTVYIEENVQSTRFRDFEANPLPMSLIDPGPHQEATDQHFRDIYNELTTDRSPKGSRPSIIDEPDRNIPEDEMAFLPIRHVVTAPPALSQTGYTYSELRYQNWKTINELLAEAEERDSEYLAQVDAAIRDGTLPPKRNNGWTRSLNMERPTGLSDLGPFPADLIESRPPTTDDQSLRENIFRLRGRLE